jgi:hypothetical protein
MISPMKTCILLPCIYLAGLLSCVAQTSDKNEEKEHGPAFRVTLFNDWEGPELFVRKKKSYTVLEAHKMAYTKPFRRSKEKPIALYTQSLSDDGEETYKPFLQIRVPSSILEPLLVLHWNAAAKKAGGMVVEFSPRKFRYGTYQLVNLSEAKIYGYIGDKKNRYSCKPKSVYISQAKYKNGARTAIVVYAAKDKKPSLVYSTLTIHRQRKRVILFLKPERNKLNRLVYRSQSLVDFKREGD